MGATTFGKILRKIRIDHNEILINMAEKLSVTASYLSAVENGKRKVPDDWVERICDLYHLSDNDRDALLGAAIDQCQSLRINLEKSSEKEKQLVFAFARRLEEMDDETCEKLRELLMRKEKPE